MQSASRVHQFYGHHGTDENSADSIVTKGFRLPTMKRDDHWLGNGLYFYKEDDVQALIWAEYKIRSTDALAGLKAMVIETYIKVPEENFLNLDSRGHMGKFENFLKEAAATLEEENLQIVFSDEDDKIRNYVFNLLPEQYYVIQRTFKVDSKYDNNEMLGRMRLHLHGVQICVRNLSVIDAKPKIVMEKEIYTYKVTKQRKHRKNRRVRLF